MSDSLLVIGAAWSTVCVRFVQHIFLGNRRKEPCSSHYALSDGSMGVLGFEVSVRIVATGICATWMP